MQYKSASKNYDLDQYLILSTLSVDSTMQSISANSEIDLHKAVPSFSVEHRNDNKISVLNVDEHCLALLSLETPQAFCLFFESHLQSMLSHTLTQLMAQQEISCGHSLAIEIPLPDESTLDLILLINKAMNSSCFDIVIVDLSRFSESKAQLSELMLRYELVVEGAYGAVWDWNLVEKTVHFSDSWCLLRKGSKADFTNSEEEWVNSIHPQDVERVLNAVSEYFEGKTDVFELEYRIVCKDGSVRWVIDRGIAKRNAHGEVIRMAGSEFDISEKRADREQLKLAASVFENITEAAVILDRDGYVINVNDAFNRLFGYHDIEEAKMNFSEIFVSSQRNIIRDLISTHPSKWSGETQIYTLNHDVISCKLTVNHVRNDDEVTHFVCLLADISESKKTQSLLYDLAYKDSLTGLPNKLSLNSFLMTQIKQHRKTQQQLALFFIDLDNFKFVNDSLGHKAGDGLLKTAAKTITSSVSEDYFIARLGGDEFVVVISHLNDSTGLSDIAQELVKNIRSRVEVQDKKVMVSASIGIAVYPNDGVDSETLIRNADAAMYQAKDHGKQTFQFYTQSLTKKAMDRMQLEASMDQAIAREEFILHYQPQTDIATKTVIGIEALIRWQPPHHALIYPDQFIALAEENNIIIDIGHWVLITACKQAKEWHNQGIEFGTMSVNVSAKQLQSDELISHVKNALSVSQLPAKYLELEITESFILHRPDAAIDRLHRLRELGVTLAIDDFGTGYSSLSYLKRLPVHRLKIDRSFIDDIPDDDSDTAITQAIIVMAEQLGLAIIAEGVETEQQAQFLLANKCGQAQGYFYSKPLPIEDVTYYLKQQQKNNTPIEQ